MSRSALQAALFGLLLAAVSVQGADRLKEDKQEGVPGPKSLGKYYTGLPQPIATRRYAKSVFKCKGKFALCAYATCVPLIGSDPPVAECGCFAFDEENLGSAPGIINRRIRRKTLRECKGKRCSSGKLYNKSTFCKRMNDGSMYPGYPLVSTFNNTAWNDATGQSGEKPEFCRGGTFADCFTAACREGPPSSPFLSPDVNGVKLNATCYCPLYTTRKTFSLPMQASCGPKRKKDLKPNTIIYNDE